MQHSYDKNSPENGHRGNLFQNNKAIYDKFTANTILNGAKLNALPNLGIKPRFALQDSLPAEPPGKPL